MLLPELFAIAARNVDRDILVVHKERSVDQRQRR